MNNKTLSTLTLTLATMCAPAAFAAEVDIPNQFTAGTRAVAEEVNENFAEVKIAIDDNAAQVTSLLNTVDELETEITALELENAALTELLQNLTLQVTLNPEIDTVVFYHEPDQSFEQDETFTVISDVMFVTSTLLKFDLSDIPSGATIETAELKLWHTDEFAPPDMEICAYQVTSAWDETVVFNNRPTRDAECITATVIEEDQNAGVFYWYGLSELVQGWLDGDNFGLALEMPNPGTVATGIAEFNSNENGRYKPELTVRYKALQ